MPLYDYDCPAGCGAFSASRPLAEFAAPCRCPGCGAASARALALPSTSALDGATRQAIAGNERSRHAPARVTGRHGAGCGCCKGAARTADAARGVARTAGSRPWALSH